VRLYEHFIVKPHPQNFRSLSRESSIAEALNYHRRRRSGIVQRGGDFCINPESETSLLATIKNSQAILPLVIEIHKFSLYIRALNSPEVTPQLRGYKEYRIPAKLLISITRTGNMQFPSPLLLSFSFNVPFPTRTCASFSVSIREIDASGNYPSV